MAVLVNPSGPTIVRRLRDVEAAAGAMGRQFRVFNASSSADIDAVFGTFAISGGTRCSSAAARSSPRRVRSAQLATRHLIPAIHAPRFYPDVVD